ncbi:MAG: flavodoxin family protein [bacterium]
MPHTVLGIAGSPRKDGSTDTLLREVLRGAEAGGAETEFVALRDKDLRPCMECGRCQALGRCVIQDEAVAIQDRLLAVDRVVFASPIFFVAVSAHAKVLIDRCQCFWSRKYVMGQPLFQPPRPGRKGLFVSCCGSEYRWMFDGARRTIKALFDVLEYDYAGELLYREIEGREAILDHPTALAEAHQAGIALAQERPTPGQRAGHGDG